MISRVLAYQYRLQYPVLNQKKKTNAKQNNNERNKKDKVTAS